MVDEYELSRNTLALISLKEDLTCIYEADERYHVEQSSQSIIDHTCRYFGSSYDGRLHGTKSLIGVSSKAPIIIEESQNLIFFPTCSPRKPICHWIALHQVKDFYKMDANHVKVLFQNGISIIVNISYYSFENQLFRATRLAAVLNQRKLMFQGNSFGMVEPYSN